MQAAITSKASFKLKKQLTTVATATFSHATSTLSENLVLHIPDRERGRERGGEIGSPCTIYSSTSEFMPV